MEKEEERELERRAEIELRKSKECLYEMKYEKIKVAAWGCLDYNGFKKEAIKLTNKPLTYENCYMGV